MKLKLQVPPVEQLNAQLTFRAQDLANFVWAQICVETSDQLEDQIWELGQLYSLPAPGQLRARLKDMMWHELWIKVSRLNEQPESQ